MQLKAEGAPPLTAAARPNLTGLADRLKAGVAALSGVSMDDVRVHRNSSKPGSLGALAYAQGSDIHLGPGQEQHLPHETWHVVQRKEGRVQATVQRRSLINTDSSLEREADLMGAKAAGLDSQSMHSTADGCAHSDRAYQTVIQCYRDANGYRFSQNDVYAIKNGADQTLYVNATNGLPATSPLHSVVSDFTTKKLYPAASAMALPIKYFPYEPIRKVLEDCMHAMEEIMHGKDLKEGEEASELRDSKGAREPSSVGNAPNLKGALNTNAGAAADPGVGEGYVLMHQTGANSFAAPYHAAVVVAKDGADDVTLEVFRSAAADQNPKRVKPEYQMYGRGAGLNQDFWNIWSPQFGGTNSVSVAVKKPLPDEQKSKG